MRTINLTDTSPHFSIHFQIFKLLGYLYTCVPVCSSIWYGMDAEVLKQKASSLQHVQIKLGPLC